ncbi:MAG: hypothetical protein HY889_05000 [Deltaproteobacteria bacterium]|nr:hypothetical protein [Deltaproteobacteria bacterium]
MAGVTHTGAVIPTVTTLTGHTPQTGDAYARLGAPTGVSIASDIALVQSDTDNIQTRLPAALLSGKMDSNAQVVGDKTGYSLTQLFPANFSALSITAGGLVEITQAAADKVWASAARTLTSFGTLVADIWGYSARTLTAFSTALAISVWDVLETAILTAGSIGLKVKTNLDAAISSRLAAEAYTAPDNAGIASIFNIVNHVTYGLSALNADLDTIIAYVDELESRLTAARAGYLDNLSEGAVALEATLEAIKGVGWTTETLVAVKALVDDLEGRLTAARATLLDNLDAPISSIWSHSNRKLTSAYTDEGTPRDMAATGSGGGGGTTVVVLPYSGSVQASYAKDGLMVEVIQGDSVSIPYDLATDLTGWTVRFGAKGSVADTAYAIAVKDITSFVTDLTNGRGLIPLTTAETSLAPGNYLGEIEIRKDNQVVTAMRFTVKIKGQVIN